MHAVIFHTGYTHVALALSQNGSLIDTCTLPKQRASRDMLSELDLLLNRSGITLTQCTFLGASIGPAPFTTLRVTLSTINGLAYATGIPLIAVDGLTAFVEQETRSLKTTYLAVILNAFCDDIYFALYNKVTKQTSRGCEPIGDFIQRLHALVGPEEPVTCVGNGFLLHQKAFMESFKNRIIVPELTTHDCTVHSVQRIAWEEWQQKRMAYQLLPLYLKSSSTCLQSPTK